jgi:hypothetical protein
MTDEAPTEVTPPPAPKRASRSSRSTAPPPAAALPPDPPPAAGPPPRLPGSVSAAAILLLIFGSLAALGTAMSLLAAVAFSFRRFGPAFDGFGGGGFDGGGMSAMGFAPFLVTLALGGAVAAAHLAAGVGILQRLAWGRILGMVVSGAALIVVGLSLAASIIWVVALPDFREIGDGRVWMDWIRNLMTWTIAVGIVVGALLIAAYAFIVWVLARADEVFE